MIKCICIDDSNRPSKIPSEKWIKKDSEYNIICAMYVMPQGKIAVQLDEIILDESCAPYEYFLAERFAFTDKGLKDLIQLIADSTRINNEIKRSLYIINERATDTK
jgi:nuclear transport factor 2 (NTF2) superfamily protein